MPKNIEDLEAVAEGVFALRDRLRHTLEQTVAVYEQLNVPLPKRQYYRINRSSTDCEEVTVSYIQSYLGSPGDQASAPVYCHSPRTAVVEVAVTRNFDIGDGGKTISAQKLMASSDWPAVDAWILLNNIEQIASEPDDLGRPQVIATVTTDPPSGGLITTRLQLTYSVLGTT